MSTDLKLALMTTAGCLLMIVAFSFYRHSALTKKPGLSRLFLTVLLLSVWFSASSPDGHQCSGAASNLPLMR